MFLSEKIKLIWGGVPRSHRLGDGFGLTGATTTSSGVEAPRCCLCYWSPDMGSCRTISGPFGLFCIFLLSVFLYIGSSNAYIDTKTPQTLHSAQQARHGPQHGIRCISGLLVWNLFFFIQVRLILDLRPTWPNRAPTWHLVLFMAFSLKSLFFLRYKGTFTSFCLIFSFFLAI